MGLFTPKYPKSATPNATGTPPPRESRAARRDREEHERIRAVMDQGWADARRARAERETAFWDDYERRNGPGSVDRT
ncbi:hypothetical protein ABZ372_26455 [Streptomyces sp. NPDC005921]|uniref:hypothetical protein n=1 Tax=Streptomyces sp. NPDC005827 TaxID=3157070 RepID=UPI003410A21D